MKFLQSLFSESGSVSMIRVLSLMVVITACVISVVKGHSEINVITALLAAGFGGKVIQKAVEKK